MAFVPCDLATIQVGCLSANVYPKVEPGMPNFECAHTFQVIKSSLEPLPINTCLILDVIGLQLNCSAIVKGLMFDWKNAFDTCWFDFVNLGILSFHNSSSAIIANTTITGNLSILLPVVDGPIATCCHQDICSVPVNCTVHFAPLISITNKGTLNFRVSFYVELPQTTRVMVNSHSNVYKLITWLGANDRGTLTPVQTRTNILKPCLHDGPITLRTVDFNLNNIQINDTLIVETIQAKILKIGLKQICASIFQHLCPGYSNQSHAAIRHVRQSLNGPDGQLVNQRMLNAARPFATQHTYAISICNNFIQGLDHVSSAHSVASIPTTLLSTTSPARTSSQILIILTAAQAAEDEVKKMQDVACGMLGQGFYSNIIGGGEVPAFSSQAKKTQSRRSKDREHLPLQCFGCSSPHPWMKDKKIICPKGMEPGCIKHVEEK